MPKKNITSINTMDSEIDDVCCLLRHALHHQYIKLTWVGRSVVKHTTSQ